MISAGNCVVIRGLHWTPLGSILINCYTYSHLLVLPINLIPFNLLSHNVVFSPLQPDELVAPLYPETNNSSILEKSINKGHVPPREKKTFNVVIKIIKLLSGFICIFQLHFVFQMKRWLRCTYWTNSYTFNPLKISSSLANSKL